MANQLERECCNGHGNRVFTVHNFGAGIMVLAGCDLVNCRNREGGLIMQLDEMQRRTISHALLFYIKKCAWKSAEARRNCNYTEELDWKRRGNEANELLRTMFNRRPTQN